MQKAHLYEAILLVNRGVDEAVRGFERLKPPKGSKLDPSCFDEELVLFEDHRARLNSYFCSTLQRTEQQDSILFETRHREYDKNTLDEVQVYRDGGFWKIAGGSRANHPRCVSSRLKSNVNGSGGTQNRQAMLRRQMGRPANDKEKSA
jgi:hypothetical protein